MLTPSRRPCRRFRGLAALAAVAVLSACGSAGGPLQPDDAPGPENASRHLDAPYVVLVSFDGFRHDYQDRFDTPAFDRLAARGVRSRGLIPVYPSKTFPGHYTLVTGLYPEHHGIVANVFWDPDRQDTYRLSDREAVEDGTWYAGEPIWVTAERQGMLAASFYWVGSEADVGGVRPTHWRRYDASVHHDQRVSTALGWLAEPPERRPHMITLYFSHTDDAGHRLGPDAPGMAESVEEADRVLGRLLDGIDALPHGDQVYVVVVSDHGMVALTTEHRIDVSRFPGARMVDRGSHANFFVDPAGPTAPSALRDSLQALLPESRVFLREDTPEALHHRNNSRIGDVVVVVAEGHQVRASQPGEGDRDGPASGGNHGFDPRLPSMHGIFLAAGPGIEPGRMVPPVEMVHLYPWLTDLLGLTPAPGLDGRAEVLRALAGG